jgi:hypothetical protein
MLRIPHCLDNRLIDGDETVSPTHRPHSTPQKHNFSASRTHSCYRLSKPQGLERQEKFISLIGSRTRDLPACGIVPYPLRYHVPARNCVGIHFSCTSTATCFGSFGPSSSDHHMNMLLVIGSFTDMDIDR